MEKLDLFKIFVNIPKIKPRKDTNTVMEEAVFILKKEYRLPPETVKAIESFESAQDQPFRVISYSNLLTKGEHAEKTVKIGNYEKKISMLLGEIFNQQLFQDVSVSKNIEKDAKELMAKQVVYSNLEGKPKGRVSYDIIILQLLQVSVKLWKKLGKSHCLTAISKDYGDVNSPLFYCLINGTPDDLESVSIFLKEVTLPCEGISIRELSSM